jgi:purine-binding chemotaxis protein CheW
VPVQHVLEVAEVGPLTPVPGAPPSILGVRNLRGQVLPVIDLAAVLGAHRTQPAGKLVVADKGGRRAGLAIDQVTDVDEVVSELHETESPFLSGSTLVEGELVGIVDVDEVFAAVERSAG